MRPRLSPVGLPLRAGWTLAVRAYELFSPVALRPRVPGVVRLLPAGPATDGDTTAGSAPGGPPAAGVRGATASARAPARPANRDSARLADPILLLEGETGARVVTAFLVENEREEHVSAVIAISRFAGPAGVMAAPAVEVLPPVLDLGPGEQALVQVSAILGPELEADVRYVARISIPGLSETTVPIAARRRVAEAA